jgi:hypothetical protein
MVCDVINDVIYVINDVIYVINDVIYIINQVIFCDVMDHVSNVTDES